MTKPINSFSDSTVHSIVGPHSSGSQIFNVEENNITPKMMTIVAEKLAANRAVRRDMTFVDCLHLKYPRTDPKPVVADPR